MSLIDITGRPIGKEPDKIVALTRQVEELLRMNAQLVAIRSDLMSIIGVLVNRHGDVLQDGQSVVETVTKNDVEVLSGHVLNVEVSPDAMTRRYVLSTAPVSVQ